MAIRAVLFDWGGTLVRERPADIGAACGAAAAALDSAGISGVSAAALYEALASVPAAWTIAELLQRALAALGAAATLQAIDAAAAAFSTSATGGLELFDDARALLPSLRYRGYAVGVVTNSLFAASGLEAAAARLGIAGYLHVIITSADCGFAKPDPRPLLLALDRLGCGPADAVFAGDRIETDVAAALAAGVTPVLIDRPGRDATPAPGVLHVAHLASINGILGERLRA